MIERVVTGGCQCGAVRYTIEGPLSGPHICHCRMCQKASGNYFMPLAGVGKNRFRLTRGEISWFRSSDPVRRGFCARCGTPLAFETIAADDIAITLGSLDRPGEVAPEKQYGTEARVPFFASLAGLPGASTEDSAAEDGIDAGHIRTSNRQHPDHDTTHWGVEDPK